MKNCLLIEILTEELPPNSLLYLQKSFSTSILEKLVNLKFIKEKTFKSYITPRRIAVQIFEVKPQSDEESQEIKLVPKELGFDNNKKPTIALQKKIEKLKLDYEKLTFIEKQIGGKIILTTNFKYPPKKLSNEISSIIEDSLTNIKFIKDMNYQVEGENHKFIRPIRNILIILDETNLNLKLFGLQTSAFTYGHRQQKFKKIFIDNAINYQQTMEEDGRVIVDYEDRKNKITQLLNSASSEHKLTHVVSERLLDDITSLCEWPMVYMAEFNNKFLNLPEECLRLTMEIHQKYISTFDEEKKISNKFLIVSDNTNPNNKNRIIKGNQKVILPRLDDANFFYNKDLNADIESMNSKLEKVTYHNKIGSQHERVQRIVEISKLMCSELSLPTEKISKAAQFCKFDLTSHMVGEFPELQGSIGGYLLRNKNYDETIYKAVQEHYHPKHADDELPSSINSQILALSDKIEILFIFFSIGIKPTGDKDPFGLRRAALGIIRICYEKQVEIDLEKFINILAEKYKKFILVENLRYDLLSFFKDRIVYFLKSKNIRYDVIDSIMDTALKNLSVVKLKLDAINKFLLSDYKSSYLEMTKRIENIIKNKNIPDQIQFETLETDCEKNLYNSIPRVKENVLKKISNHNYFSIFSEILSVKEHVNFMFDNLLIISENKINTLNRLYLLNAVLQLSNYFFNSTKLIDENK